MKNRKRAAGGGRKPAPRAPLGAEVSPLELDGGFGLPAAIVRLQRAEEAAARDYQLAVSTRDIGLIAAAKKTWCDLVESLRKVEATNPDVEQANAQTLPVSDVERETSRMVAAFRVALEALPRSLPQKLVGADEVGIQEILSKAVNEVLGQLHTGEWKI